MKPKLICLLIILIGSSLLASSNNYCSGLRCSTGKLASKVTTIPVEKVVMMIDEVELLPIHHFLNNF